MAADAQTQDQHGQVCVEGVAVCNIWQGEGILTCCPMTLTAMLPHAWAANQNVKPGSLFQSSEQDQMADLLSKKVSRTRVQMPCILLHNAANGYSLCHT